MNPRNPFAFLDMEIRKAERVKSSRYIVNRWSFLRLPCEVNETTKAFAIDLVFTHGKLNANPCAREPLL
jgi:hypothetical protein